MVLNYETLYQAWKDESKGKRGFPNQEKYRYYLEENLYNLQERLNSGTFEPAPLRIKNIYYPKRRKAQIPNQEDKIVQHAICDNSVYHSLVRSLIGGASANTRGRGTNYGTERLKEDLRSFWAKYKKPPYILKGDVHSFFGSIPHDRASELLVRYVGDPDERAILKKFLGLTDEGLPLGLQQSQLIANLYLSELDHKLKEQKAVKYYGRHMDDFYILSESKESLSKLLLWIRDYLAVIGLTLNPKTKICYKTFDYLGYSFLVSDTGKIIIRVAKSKLKSKRRHLKKLARQLASGEISASKIENAYFGWRQHALKAKNARTQVLNTDRFFAEELQKIGYRLTIYKANKGKLRWRVAVTRERMENKCHEQ